MDRLLARDPALAAMKRLDERGLVDRAHAYMSSEFRTYLTTDGRRLAAQGRAMVEAVSEQMR